MHTPKKSFDTPPGRSGKSTGTKGFSPQNDEGGGRFIPNRVSSNLKLLFEKAEQENNFEKHEEPPHKFSDFLHSQLFKSPTSEKSSSNTFFKYKPPLFPGIENKENNPHSIFETTTSFEVQGLRKFAKTPFKILDAPNLRDDFYIDVVSWSNRNIIAIGLNNEVYLWNAETLKVTCLCSFSSDSVASVQWNSDGLLLAVGTGKGRLVIYDVISMGMVLSLNNHQGRVGTLSWTQSLLSSGSRDCYINHQDTRSGSTCSKVYAHRQEICKIKWSPNNDYLVSGGNDNKICLWSSLNPNPVHVFSGHSAAVKALDWCPYASNILASGGGTADKTVRLWNVHTNELTQVLETKSQVCNLRFSQNSHEIVTTHGYSENLINVWKYPCLQPVGELRGHSSRVLYLDISPDRETVVTGAGDETLRFWKLFPANYVETSVTSSVTLAMNEVR
jgi:cell division cycle 20-like protein 1 (cofactor of APC complex)